MNRPANPDQALLARALSEGLEDIAFEANPLAIDLQTRLLRVTPQGVALSFLPGERHLQGEAIVQGGILTTMLDFAMAFAVLARLAPNQSAATLNLSVNFLRPARAGRLQAEGRIERLGARVAFATAQLQEADGRLVASATSTLAITQAA
jgi:uncharacterized protein (TIGR00369 family)